MKTQVKHVSKRALSVVLAVMMIVSTMLVGMVTINAASTDTVYIVPANLFDDYVNDSGELDSSDYYIRIYYRTGTYDQDGWEVAGNTFAKSNETIDSKAVYKCDFTSINGGTSNFEIELCGDNETVLAETVPYGTNAWHESSNYSGKLWNGTSWVEPVFDDPDTPPTPPPLTSTYILHDGDNEVGGLEHNGSCSVELTKDQECHFYVTKGTDTYLNGAKTFGDDKSVLLYKNDNDTDDHKIYLKVPVTGTYTFYWDATNDTGNNPYGKLSYTGPTAYYIGGRLGQSWNANSTNQVFVESSTKGVYSYNTGKTVKELSEKYSSLEQFFFIHTDGVGNGKTWYGGTSTNKAHDFQNRTENNKFSLETLTVSNTNDTNNLLRFNNTGSTVTGKVVLWLDTNTTESDTHFKLWYTTEAEAPSEAGIETGYELFNGENEKLAKSLGKFKTTTVNNTYELTVELKKTTYSLFIKDENPGELPRRSYYRNTTITVNGAAVSVYHYDDVDADGISAKGDRVTFVCPEAGSYTFTFKCEVDKGDTSNGTAILGAHEGKLSVKKAGTPVADSVTISTVGDPTFLVGEPVEFKATVVNSKTENLKYRWYRDDVMVQDSGSDTFRIEKAVNGYHYYKCTVYSDDNDGTTGNKFVSVTSAQFRVRITGRGLFYSTNLSNEDATVSWTEVTGDTATIKVESGLYEFALSDIGKFNEEFTEKYTLDKSASKYVKLSTGTYDYNDAPITKYIVAPNDDDAVKNIEITIDKNAKKIYAVGKIDKSTFKSGSTLDSTKLVRYYFAEEKGHEKKSNPTTGTGMQIRYWNNSVNKSNAGTRKDVTGIATLSDGTSNKIYVNVSELYIKGGNSANVEFDIYYADLPVSATSFCFVEQNGTTIKTNSTSKSSDYFGSLALNPNRVYLLYHYDNAYKCTGVILDNKLWSQNGTNQVELTNFKSSVINYAAFEHSANGGRITENSNINKKLKENIYPTGYEHPLYFGYLGSNGSTMDYNDLVFCGKGQYGGLVDLTSGSGNTKAKLWDNLAFRTSDQGDDRYYHASVQGLVGDELDKDNSLLYAGSNDKHILFNYDEAVSKGIVYSNQVYKDINFPFNKSEYNGVVTYSYDSTTDYNREINTATGKFKSPSGYQDSWLGGAGVGYFPFGKGDYSYGFGTEFNIEFYMSSTGKLTSTDKNLPLQDITFDFSGDDDVWVYVDGVLVLDLGGAHKISAGSINFSEMKVYYKSATKDSDALYKNNDQLRAITTDVTSKQDVKTINLQKLLNAYGVDFSNTDATQKHTLQMFYMERGSFDSNMSISFNLPQSSGLTIRNTVNSSDVNPGLVDAAMRTANKDYFSYNVTDSLITGTTAGELENIYGELNGKNSITVRKELGKTSVTKDDKDTFGIIALKIFYQSGFNVLRECRGTQYNINNKHNPDGSNKQISSSDYLTELNNGNAVVKGVVYELRDRYFRCEDEEDINNYYASGMTDNNGNLNLLFDQAAVFDSTILANTMLKVSQSNQIYHVSTNGEGTIAKGGDRREVNKYYKTSYEIYDVSTKKTVSPAKTYVRKDDSDEDKNIYAAEIGSDKNIYFSNYDGNADNPEKMVSMSVTFENKIQVGSITIEKQFSDEDIRSSARFHFDVQFSNVFGSFDKVDYVTRAALVYDVYDINDDGSSTLVSTDNVYGGPGVVIRAGQFAVIKGVPVGTKYRITERSTSGYSLSDASGTVEVASVTYSTEAGADNIRQYKNTKNEVIGIEGEIPAVTSDNDATKVKAIMINSPQALTITYKYYGREITNGTVAHIGEKPKSYTIEFSSPSEYSRYFTRNENDGEIVSFNMSGLIANTFKENICSPDNVVDDYKFFSSQKQAVEKMMSTPKIYEAGTYSAAEAQYHTNYVGQRIDEDDPDYGKWVTYYDADHNEVDEVDNAADSGVYGSVTNVVVWLFNTLHEYDVKAYGIKDADKITSIDTNFTKVEKTGNDGKNQTLWVLKPSTNTDGTVTDTDKYNDVIRKAYYNQRLGGRSDVTNQNNEGLYLRYYNQPAYLSVTPTTVPEFTVGNTTYYFQYWMNADNVILSTDINYRNRITSDLKIYPVYAETKFNGYGVSVTMNTRDQYSVDINDKFETKVRLNTQMHVYGLQDNAPIEKVAIINVKATDFPEGGLNSEQLKQVRDRIVTIFRGQQNQAKRSGNIYLGTQYIGKANAFVYNVSDADVTLTNKNRVQFSVEFKEETLFAPASDDGTVPQHNMPIAAFAAIYYDGKWTVSDNYVIYDLLKDPVQHMQIEESTNTETTETAWRNDET